MTPSGGRKTARTNEQWSKTTTDALRRAARREFAKAGYANASVEHIADEANLTKGAVYYHFGNKRGLFEAVFRDVQQDVVRVIEERAGAARDPIEGVIAGCEAFVDIALDDELRQVALVDGPRVLGWSKWRAIDSELGLGSLKEGLRECERSGALRDVDTDALAHLISGALNEAVFLIAESDDRTRAHSGIARTLTRFLRAVVV